MNERRNRRNWLTGLLVFILLFAVGFGYPKLQKQLEDRAQAAAAKKLAALTKQLQKNGTIGARIAELSLEGGFISPDCTREAIEKLMTEVKQVETAAAELSTGKQRPSSAPRLGEAPLKKLSVMKEKLLIQSAVNSLYDYESGPVFKGSNVEIEKPLNLMTSDDSGIRKINRLLDPLPEDEWKWAVQNAIENVEQQLDLNRIINNQLQELQVRFGAGATNMTKETQELIQMLINKVKTSWYRDSHQERFDELQKKMPVKP